jgi:sulfate permease, SulP family
VLTVAFVCVVQTATTERLSAEGSGVEPESGTTNRDLAAVGAGSLLAGLTGSYAVNASPPRTAAVANAGGRTQLTGLLAVAVALVVAGVGGPVLADLPEATLGAILIFVATRLFHFDQLFAVWRYDHFEFALGLLTGAVVALVGIEQGIVVAAVLALAQRTRLAARPRDAILGREPGTDHWIPLDVGQPTEEVPGVVVYMLYAPVWYGNAGHVRARVLDAVSGKSDTPVRALVFDADGVSDVDYTGAQELRRLIATLTERGIGFYVARSSQEVHHDLSLGGLLTGGRIHATVADAVAAASA